LVQMADDVAQARVLTAVGRAGPGT
jgi:hypothetical protein